MIKRREYPIYKELSDAFDFYNNELFSGTLPECIMTLSTKENSYGHFCPYRFISIDKNNKKHEIAMNIKKFAIRDIKETLATMVHEMCHLYMFEINKYSKNGYHNKKWANFMIEIGLMPSTTGMEGGEIIGYAVHHYIIKGGLFENKTEILLNKGYIIPFVERLSMEIKKYDVKELKLINKNENIFVNKKGEEFEGEYVKVGNDDKGNEIIKIIDKGNVKYKKVTYKCKCENTVYGKNNLNILCKDCGEIFKVYK
jgi:predicted SprT family Zn-dependent metalloprotease